MKRKTINAIITKKMKEWWATLPEELAELAQKHTVVTGGCIASMLQNEKVSDYDVYFSNKQTARRIAEHYVAKFIQHRKQNSGIELLVYLDDSNDRLKIVVKSAGTASEDDSRAQYEYFETQAPEEAAAYIDEVYDGLEQAALENEDGDYRPVFMSTNAITLSQKVQIILRFIGTPAEIHENYDFVHCTNYWTLQEGVVLNQAALESLITKELRYVGSRYPLCSIIRTRKFISRGWTINAGQYVKMCWQLNQLDLTDIAVLEEQLTGVDVAYFQEVIKKLSEKGQKRVDSAYLLEIIERMF